MGRRGATEHFEMILKGHKRRMDIPTKKTTECAESQKCGIVRQLQVVPRG